MARGIYRQPPYPQLPRKLVPAPVGDCYFDTVVADAPIAYWRLGEPSGTNAVEEIGGNDGTYVNTPTLGEAGALPGDTNTGILLTAASTEHVTAAALDLGDGPLSYEFWFKRASASNPFMGMLGGGTNTPGVYWNNSSGDGRIEIGKSGGTDFVRTSVLTNDTTTWHHLVATKPVNGGGNAAIYLDGVDVTTVITGNQACSNAASSFYMGVYAPTVGSPFDGSLDEVAVYDYVLSGSQVAAHYAARLVTCEEEAAVTTVPAQVDAPFVVSELVDDQSVQSYAIQPPAAAPFNPANGFPWNQDQGERFVDPQCYPDPTTDLATTLLPPVLRAWSVDGGEVQQRPSDDPSVQAWAIQPPAVAAFDPTNGFPWARDDGERFVASQTVDEPDFTVAFDTTVFDPTNGFPWARDDGERFVQSALIGEDWQAWAVQPPAVAAVTQLSAFAVEGGEVQAQPTGDPSVQAWAVGPPQNAVQALAFNTPDEAREVPVEDPTVPTYAIQPPPYTPVLQTTAWTGDPDNWQQQPVEDPSVQAWAVQPIAAPAFDPSTTPWTGRDDIVQPVWFTPDTTGQPWAIVPPVPFVGNRSDEPIIPAWLVPSDGSAPWTATLGVIPTVTGGFPPGGTAAGPLAGGDAWSAVPGGAGSNASPGGEAVNPKPGVS